VLHRRLVVRDGTPENGTRTAYGPCVGAWGKLPCASDAYSTQEGGTPTPYVQVGRPAGSRVNTAARLIVGLIKRDEDRVERKSHGECEQAIHTHVKQRVRNDRGIQPQLHGRCHVC
jgi:hypothetical protein